VTQQGSEKQVSQHVLAFVAAGLFCFAGLLFLWTSLHLSHIGPAALGAMFLSIGLLWVVIGIKLKKDGK
jgi:hypothetical protein